MHKMLQRLSSWDYYRRTCEYYTTNRPIYLYF
jgi:hypothetical protein